MSSSSGLWRSLKYEEEGHLKAYPRCSRRELATPAAFPGSFGFPSCDCVVRAPTGYQWRSEGFRPPAFNDLIIYQFHVGVFSGPDSKRDRCEGTFLDVLDKVEHLVRLGVSEIEPLPIDEAGAA